MRRQRSIRLAGAIFIAVALLLLLPCLSMAGSLEPSGPPEPTMKTLDQIPPTWSQKLQCDSTACPRFEIVMDGAAVLDKETGIVWQRSPMNVLESWYGGQWSCHASNVGGRFGWRLPTAQELESLMDLSNSCWPNGWGNLPCGHPFLDLQYAYWSSTTWFFDSNEAIAVNYGGFPVDKSADLYVWCVRGGFGINVNE